MGLVPRQLYVKLSILLSLIVVATFVSYSWMTAGKQAEIYKRIMRDDQTVVVKSIAESCARYLVLSDYAGLDAFLLKSAELPAIRRIQVYEKDGGVLSDISRREGGVPVVNPVPAKKKDLPDLSADARMEDGQMVVQQPIIAGAALGWIEVSYSMKAIDEMETSIWRNNVLPMALWICLSFVLLFLALQRPLRAIKGLSQFAKSLNARKGDQLPVSSASIEIEQLGEALNDASRELYETEQQLVAERERLKVTLQSIGDGVIATDIEGRVVLLNNVAEGLTGWTSTEAQGRPLPEIFHIINERTRQPAENPAEKVLATGKIIGLANHTALLSKDGVERSIADSGAPIIDNTGKIVGVVVVFRDVTEYKRAEEEVRLNEVRFEALFRLSQMSGAAEGEIVDFALNAGVEFTQSSVGYLHFVNEDQKTINLCYWSRSVMRECSAKSISHYPLDAAGIWADCIRAGKPVIHNDYQGITDRKGYPEGHLHIFRHMSVPIRDNNKIVAIAGVGNSEGPYSESDARQLYLFMNDMWKLLKQKRSDEFIKDVLETIGEGLAVIDREYKIITANKAYGRFVSVPIEHIVGENCYKALHGSGVPCYESGAGYDCPVRHTFATGETRAVIHKFQNEAGKTIILEVSSFPMRAGSGSINAAIVIINDVTERMQLEEQLRQSQKMEAIGGLTGGIAHDFNNILTAIIGYGTLLRMNIKDDDPVRVYADHILASGERAAELTRNLLAFSRKQIVASHPVDLNDIVSGIGKLLKRLIGEDIEFKTRLSDERVTVMADKAQIEQVLMNLATNARDAMPHGGLLTIETGLFYADEHYTKMHLVEKPGPYAFVSVSDAGVGMDEKVKERVFEPFYTTKEVGKGTGLGLSIVYGIIKQHSGYINLYSEPGKGTTFKIYLPLLTTAIEKEQAARLPAPKGGTETILVAEDDGNVRSIIRETLESKGYTVIEAGDGERAVGLYKEEGKRIDLILLDVVMPRKNGREAYEEIRRLNGDAKTLFMSGYTADIISSKAIIEENFAFIEKPISPDKLLRKVREVLDGK